MSDPTHSVTSTKREHSRAVCYTLSETHAALGPPRWAPGPTPPGADPGRGLGLRRGGPHPDAREITLRPHHSQC